MVKIKETHHTTFISAGHAKPTRHDQFSASNGLRVADGRLISVTPWSTNAKITIGASNTLDDIYTAFAHRYNGEPVVFIGKEGTTLTSVYGYRTGTPYTNVSLIVGVSALGGQPGQNHIYTDLTQLFLIDFSGNIYRGNYTGALASVYSSPPSARLLTVWNDTIYMLTDTGEIHSWDDGTSAFIAQIQPEISTRPLWAIPFRGYLLVAAWHANGDILLQQVTPTHTLRTIYQLANAHFTIGASPTLEGHAAVIHNGDIYFLDRTWTTLEDATIAIDIWRFDGAEVHFVDRVTVAAAAPSAAGLISWNHNNLILYALRDGTSPTHNTYILTGDHFTPLHSISDTGTVTNPALSHIDSQLLLTRVLAGDSTFTVLGPGTITAAAYFTDTSLETGRLDFGTGRQKLLHTIAAQLDDSAHTLTLKYKIDGAATWTTAASAAGSRLAAEDIGITFYTLEIRLEITAAASTTAPYTIESLTVIHTEK